MNLILTTKKLLVIALTTSLLTTIGCYDDEEDASEYYSKQKQTNVSDNSNVNEDIPKREKFIPKIGKYSGRRLNTSFGPPKTFNLYLAAESSSNDILGQMYIGLVTIDPASLEVIPNLAESWKVLDDRMTYIVKMKPNLKWSDGNPLTADDVVFTFNEVINNPDIPTNSRDGMLVDGVFPKVEKIDDLTVKFVTSKPFVPFLKNGLAAAIAPKHILSNLVKKDKDGRVKFNQWGSLNADPNTIVCNGPFKLKEYVAGQRVILAKNPYYWKKDAEGNQLPYLDEFITEIVKDQEVEVIKFKAKDSDALAVRGKDFETIRNEQTKGDFTIHNLGPSTGTLFVMFNMSTVKTEKGEPIIPSFKSKWFRNPKFRQALAHAIDKKTIVNSVYRGLAYPQISDISQQNPYYNPNIKDYEYNLDTALKMLQEIGFKKNDKDQLVDSENNRVEFDLVTNVGNAPRDAACAIIRSDWEKLGMKINYRPIQFNVMVQQIDETVDWESMMIGLTGSATEPHSGINVWRLSGRMHMFNMGNPIQNPRWVGRGTSYEQWEKDVIALYEKGSQEFDEEKRKQIYWKTQEIIAENLPFLYTVNPTSLIAIRNNIGNVYPTIQGGTGLNQVNWNTQEQYILTP